MSEWLTVTVFILGFCLGAMVILLVRAERWGKKHCEGPDLTDLFVDRFQEETVKRHREAKNLAEGGDEI